jgi:uncharacterized protein YecT (DUF1311 family)
MFKQTAVAFVFALSFVNVAHAADRIAPPNTCSTVNYTTDGWVGFHTGPGAEFAMVTTLHAGDLVQEHEYDGDWIHATVNGQDGWVSGKLRTSAACPQEAPSFNCQTNRAPDEVTICGSSGLSMLDRQMSDLYSAVWDSLNSADQNALRNEQHAWLAQRSACGTDASCISRLFQIRMAQCELGSPGGCPQYQILCYPISHFPPLPRSIAQSCGLRWEAFCAQTRLERPPIGTLSALTWPKSIHCPKKTRTLSRAPMRIGFKL